MHRPAAHHRQSTKGIRTAAVAGSPFPDDREWAAPHKHRPRLIQVPGSCPRSRSRRRCGRRGPARTNSARVGLVLPKEFALGAATGAPASSINFRATGCRGILTPTRGRPAVTMAGTCGPLGNNKVKGPGQNASINKRPLSGMSTATMPNCSWLTMCTIRGSHEGLCLASKIACTAAWLRAFAPSP